MLNLNAVCKRGEHVGIRGIQYEQLRKTGLGPECLSQDFRTERRPSHAANHYVPETSPSNQIRKLNKFIGDCDHLIWRREPAQRVLNYLLIRVVCLPQRSILAPDALHYAIGLGFLYRLTHRLGELT